MKIYPIKIIAGVSEDFNYNKSDECKIYKDPVWQTPNLETQNLTNIG